MIIVFSRYFCGYLFCWFIFQPFSSPATVFHAAFFNQNVGETHTKKYVQDSLKGTAVDLSCDKDDTVQQDPLSRAG